MLRLYSKPLFINVKYLPTEAPWYYHGSRDIGSSNKHDQMVQRVKKHKMKFFLLSLSLSLPYTHPSWILKYICPFVPFIYVSYILSLFLSLFLVIDLDFFYPLCHQDTLTLLLLLLLLHFTLLLILLLHLALLLILFFLFFSFLLSSSFYFIFFLFFSLSLCFIWNTAALLFSVFLSVVLIKKRCREEKTLSPFAVMNRVSSSVPSVDLLLLLLLFLFIYIYYFFRLFILSLLHLLLPSLHFLSLLFPFFLLEICSLCIYLFTANWNSFLFLSNDDTWVMSDLEISRRK